MHTITSVSRWTGLIIVSMEMKHLQRSVNGHWRQPV